MMWLLPEDGLPRIKQAKEGKRIFYVPGVRETP